MNGRCRYLYTRVCFNNSQTAHRIAPLTRKIHNNKNACAPIISISLITNGRINNPPADRRNSNSMIIKWRSSRLGDMNFSLPSRRRFHARNCHRQFYSHVCMSETCRCASRLYYFIILLSRNKERRPGCLNARVVRWQLCTGCRINRALSHKCEKFELKEDFFSSGIFIILEL